MTCRLSSEPTGGNDCTDLANLPVFQNNLTGRAVDFAMQLHLIQFGATDLTSNDKKQTGRESRAMKVATFSRRRRAAGRAGRRRATRTVAPFDLPADEAAEGVVALIRRDGALARDALALSRSTGSTLEAPIPRAAPQHLLRRQELSRARPRVLAERLRFERRRRRRAEASDHLLQGARDRRPARPPRPDRSGRVRRRSTTRPNSPSSSASRAAASASRRRLRPCLGLHHRQRRHRPRPAGPLQPVARRQIAGHVLPDGARSR